MTHHLWGTTHEINEQERGVQSFFSVNNYKNSLYLAYALSLNTCSHMESLLHLSYFNT